MNASSIINRIPPVTKNLLIINILIWLITALLPGVEAKLIDLFALHYFTSPDFNAAQLITYMFLHSGLTHLFFNMFALWMFGSIIERSLGSARFLLYYVSCGIGAALIQEGVLAIMVHKYYEMFTPAQMEEIISTGARFYHQNLTFSDPTYAAINAIVNAPTLGASGAVFGVLLAFGMLFPNQPIYMMFIPIPIKAKWFVLGYGALEFFLGVNGLQPGVAHFAHLGGMLIGVFMILYWKKNGDLNNRWFF